MTVRWCLPCPSKRVLTLKSPHTGVGSPYIPHPYYLFDSTGGSPSSSPGLTRAGAKVTLATHNEMAPKIQFVTSLDVMLPTQTRRSQNTSSKHRQLRWLKPPRQAALTSSPRPSGLNATHVAWRAVPNVPTLPPRALPPLPEEEEDDEAAAAAFPAAGCSFAGQNDRAGGGCRPRLPPPPPPLVVSTYPVESTLPRGREE